MQRQASQVLSRRLLRHGVSAGAAAVGGVCATSLSAQLTGVRSLSTLCRVLRSAAATPPPPPPPSVGGDVEDVEETHPDFHPRMVAGDLAADEVAAIKADIRDTIRDEDVVVFIKGVPEAPMCAFSKRMIDVMEALGVEYTSFDVLAHPVVRSYVKEVSEWPTIPQVFVKGEFAGGVDIVLKMAESGDLQQLLDQKGVKHRDTKL
ncbi:monothiol glutaredoxin [Novymonas esmeraldas]|uniref:Monothiol glutaredoxin n=1 Tax=Novymonas esmeraldas TaxID=1808958 RepID=A0AAW0EL68_9TRYP